MHLVRSMAAAFAMVAALASQAAADVSCADPNNLCTGDPCTITTVSVQSPCVVDFGARTLIVAGTVSVPDDGTLSFTAATIIQRGPIDGRHIGHGSGRGASITFHATSGDVELRGRIDVAGTVATGSIDVQAAGNILVKDALNAKPAGAVISAGGGQISLAAGGTVFTDQTAPLDAVGIIDVTPGGSISVHGDAGVTAKGPLRAAGSPAGSVDVASSAGMVTIVEKVNVASTTAAGGSLTIDGAAGVVVEDKVSAFGGTGGSVTITSSGGDVDLKDRIRARGVDGGVVDVEAPVGHVTNANTIDASSVNGQPGSITIAAATITVRRDLSVVARSGPGGDVMLGATSLLEMRGGDAETGGGTDGGTVTLVGDTGATITIQANSSLNARGRSGNGGVVSVSAPDGTVAFEGDISADGGVQGGSADVQAGALTVDGVRFTAGGDIGGALHFLQNGAGLFRLAGVFETRDSGTIEASAPAGDLTASGSFRARPSGCIGLSAGGTLDVTNVVADVPITPSCP